MNQLRLNASKRLRLISTSTRRLISTNRRRLISIAVGALLGAVVGGIIEGLDYAVFLADLHHRYGINPFEFGDLGYLVAKAIVGAVVGAVCGFIGGIMGAFVGFARSPRKIAIRTAGGVVIGGVAACVACVALAAFGIAVVGIPGPLGAITVGDLLIGICSYAAGVVVGAVRAGN